jgi:hypothetical protein
VLLTPDEKAKLDERSIRNASLWLDLRVAVMTASMFVRGDRRTAACGTDRLEQSPPLASDYRPRPA